MTRVAVFSFPWPGLGNSEGPGETEESYSLEGMEAAEEAGVGAHAGLLATFPWPGPGDSEA